MKERLRELAEQAGRGQERWNTTAQFESFLEKFAELIIKECGEVAVFGDTKFSAQHNIHKHFGVE